MSVLVTVLMVLSSHARIANTRRRGGIWLDEFASTYYALREGGASVSIASPKGGDTPIDRRSTADSAKTDATRRLTFDEDAQWALAHTTPIAKITPADFSAFCFPGSHGALVDVANNLDCRRLVEWADSRERPLGLVCHGPGVLAEARRPDGKPLIAGREVTGFSSAEETSIGMEHVAPFLVEDALKAVGGKYSCASEWDQHVVTDGNLVTGQNPASYQEVACRVLELI